MRIRDRDPAVVVLGEQARGSIGGAEPRGHRNKEQFLVVLEHAVPERRHLARRGLRGAKHRVALQKFVEALRCEILALVIHFLARNKGHGQHKNAELLGLCLGNTAVGICHNRCLHDLPLLILGHGAVRLRGRGNVFLLKRFCNALRERRG